LALYVGDSLFHHDNTPYTANEHDLIAKMGGAPVGMEELSGNNVLVCPNPAQNQLFIQTEDIINRVSVINIAGQTIMNMDVNDYKSTSLNVSGLSSGVYLVQIETSSDFTIKRGVIQ
jgi:uncharacterized protein YacL (UPF0231 family)